jgi:hypothetical protein
MPLVIATTSVTPRRLTTLRRPLVRRHAHGSFTKKSPLCRQEISFMS